MDAPYESSGPSLEEGRNQLIIALDNSDYPLDIIAEYVDKYIDEEIDEYDRYPFGSDRGFAMSFDIIMEEIKKLILKSSSKVDDTSDESE